MDQQQFWFLPMARCVGFPPFAAFAALFRGPGGWTRDAAQTVLGGIRFASFAAFCPPAQLTRVRGGDQGWSPGCREGALLAWAALPAPLLWAALGAAGVGPAVTSSH